jgi:hypothetical protein
MSTTDLRKREEVKIRFVILGAALCFFEFKATLAHYPFVIADNFLRIVSFRQVHPRGTILG